MRAASAFAFLCRSLCLFQFVLKHAYDGFQYHKHAYTHVHTHARTRKYTKGEQSKSKRSPKSFLCAQTRKRGIGRIAQHQAHKHHTHSLKQTWSQKWLPSSMFSLMQVGHLILPSFSQPSPEHPRILKKNETKRQGHTTKGKKESSVRVGVCVR